MVCYHPISCYLVKDLDTFQNKVVFYDHPRYYKGNYSVEPFQVPCGRCIGCRLERSRQWAVRCVHESQMHEKNCFITLTYNDEHLPKDKSVNVSHFQKFMKRLRKRFGEGIRFFHCGEYGELLERPHYHAILFGFDFPDKKLFSVRNGVRLYVSEELQKLWPFGFSTIGDATFESAAYVARYVTKKINGAKAEEHYKGRKPEYITMSRRPGIAYDWIQKYKDEVYVDDSVIIKGHKTKPPRYYDRIYDLTNSEDMAYIKYEREKAALARADDNTPERLKQKEEVQLARYSRLKRNLERKD